MSPKRRDLAAGLALLAVVLPACGGDDDAGPPRTPPTAKPAEFPEPGGKTLAELRRGLPPGPVLSPSVRELEPAENRYGFGLFDRARQQIADAPTVLYVARPGGPAKGPYPARYQSLAVKPQFQSRSTASDTDAADSVYVATLPFKRPGNYEVLGVVRLDDRLAATDPVAAPVERDTPVPEVGERAVKVSTPTRASVGGDVEKIDTRVPPSTMHEKDFANVLGKRPVVLVFATPALCRSRVCGPVVDIAEQVKATRGEDVEFIHMEIYNDNELERGFRPQVGAWRLRTEPWAFVIDRVGRIAARFEGAFGASELERAVDGVTRR